MKQLLKTLTETFGPSGYEDAVRKVILKEVKLLADEVQVDALGNLIVHKNLRKGLKIPKRLCLLHIWMRSVLSSAILIKKDLRDSPMLAGLSVDTHSGRESAF